MRLYQNKHALNPRRARMFMAEKGVNLANLELIEIRLDTGENREPGYLAKNPFGRVPTLELDDGTCIGDSMAICRYFEETIPDPPLMGTDAKDRALVTVWQRRMEVDLLLNVSMAFRHLSGFFADREKVIEEWGQVCLETATEMFDYLDGHLADNEHVAGDRFSIADITALCAIDFARVVKLRVDDRRPNLQRWHQAVSSRPSAQV